LVQGDLQILPSQDTILRGIVVGFTLGEDHVDYWMLLTTKSSRKSVYERVGIALFSHGEGPTPPIDWRAADAHFPFRTIEEEIVLS